MRLVVGLIALTSCYGPTPHPGAPCGEDGACPAPLICAAATSTCEVDPSTIPPGDGGPIDTTSDGEMVVPPDAPDLCFGTGLVTTCLDSVPTSKLTVSGAATINTSNDASCTKIIGANPALCVVAATEIDVAGTLRVEGTRPIVLISMTTNEVGVTGEIDASSRRTFGAAVGAGADVGCGTG
ncbi:MAG: hypothetical protein AB7O24_16495, partial [Kofleriaceae bacterium]